MLVGRLGRSVVAGSAGGGKGVALNAGKGDTAGLVGSLSLRESEILGASPAEMSGVLSSRDQGNLHFPSAFCGQTTFGLTSETSLITNRREKSERKRTRRRNVLASRKCLELAADRCAIVMPLSSSRPH